MSEIGLVDGDSIIDAVGLNVSDSDVTDMSCMEVREHKDFRGEKKYLRQHRHHSAASH